MKCPNCGFGYDGKFCPMCGTKVPEQPVITTKKSADKNKLKNILIAVLCAFSVALICTNVLSAARLYNISKSNSQAATIQQTVPKTTISPTLPATTDTPAKTEVIEYVPADYSNKSVRFGSVALKSIQPAAANDEFAVNYKYTLQEITFEITNTSDNPCEVGYCSIEVFSNGIVKETLPIKDIDYELALKILNPNEKAEFKAVYAIPKSYSDIQIKLKFYSSTEDNHYYLDFSADKK